MPVTKEHEQEFLVSFAKAFLSWQYVENVLFMLFNTLMKHDKPELVSAAWYAVISFEARLSMVDEVFKAAIIDQSLRTKWARLRKRVSDRASSRNSLAHLTVTAITSETGISELKLSPTVFKISSKPSVERDIKQLNEADNSFRELADDLYEFQKDIALHIGRRTPLPGIFPKQSAD